MQEVTSQEVYSKHKNIAHLLKDSNTFLPQAGRGKWEGRRGTKKEIMAENFLNLGKDLDIQVHEANISS